jgi:ubiquinol-cytochrome c reductase iron-sulfur subunit
MAKKITRRNFITKITGVFAGIGIISASWAAFKSMFPDAVAKAMEKKRIDISGIEEGSGKTFEWNGKPVFVRRRTQDEINQAQNVDVKSLMDPEKDENRVIKPEWLVVFGTCTHMGCIPMGQNDADERGDFGGWFCQCHGAMYDTSGRVRKGPAQKNLKIPKYRFVDDSTIELG